MQYGSDTYLIPVISFTGAGFLDPIFYTQKLHKIPVKLQNIHLLHPILKVLHLADLFCTNIARPEQI